MSKPKKADSDFSVDTQVTLDLRCAAPGWPWAMVGADNEPVYLTPTQAANLLQAAVGKRKAMGIMWRWVAESELEQLEVAND